MIQAVDLKPRDAIWADLLERAGKFYLNALLPGRLAGRLRVYMTCAYSPSGDDRLAVCSFLDDCYRPREYEICFLDFYTLEEMLVLLAHECVHVAQYATGRMRTYKNPSRRSFRGCSYDTNLIDYRDLPWEVEAYDLEGALYAQYVKKAGAPKSNRKGAAAATV